VKTCRYFQTAKDRVWVIAILFLILILLLLSSAAVAVEPSQQNGALADNNQIQIVADKLVTNNQEKFAEFSGDVRASQGTFVITSERLRIYYQTGPDSAENKTTGQESIKQVVASGNVQVSTEKFTAETDRVEYDMETQVVVLLGENSTLKSNKNVLTGSKITVDRKTGQMKVESDPQKRVKAIFYPPKNTEKKE
jgi:lipopolysaccharide export system protein LptA